jgi:glycosyltransferase involved in cell wall biosynthesis
MNKPLISAIICTYNRANILQGAIESLIQQTADNGIFEIIVVDNNSTDNTREIVEQFGNIENLRYVFEPNQGLSHARNRGYLEAQGKYVAYIDDDARADKEWISGIQRILEDLDPHPLVIGGPIYPFYLSDKPDWFLDKYEIHSWGDEPRFLKRNEYFYGSNMVFSKDVLEESGGFDTERGVSGETLNLGEETVLFDKIWKKSGNGNNFYYSPDLIVYHLVPPERMSIRYFLKRRFMVGQSSLCYRFGKLTHFKRIYLPVLLLGGVAYYSVIALFKVPFYRHYQNWVVECLDPAVVGIGLFIGALGIHPEFKQYKL